MFGHDITNRITMKSNDNNKIINNNNSSNFSRTADSPASVPSMSGTSYASSELELLDDDDAQLLLDEGDAIAKDLFANAYEYGSDAHCYDDPIIKTKAVVENMQQIIHRKLNDNKNDDDNDGKGNIDNNENKATGDDDVDDDDDDDDDDDNNNSHTRTCGSEISITSSETTVVASSNLSSKPPKYHPDEDGHFPSLFAERTRVDDEDYDDFVVGDDTAVPRYPKSSDDDDDGDSGIIIVDHDDDDDGHDDDSDKENRAPPPDDENQEVTVTFEEPEEVSTCSSAMSITPRQLAEVFLAFEGARSIWPSSLSASISSGNNNSNNKRSSDSSGDSNGKINAESPKKTEPASAAIAVTPSPKMFKKQRAVDPMTEALERECNSLKKIIQEDSSKLVDLQQAMKAQRELNSLKEIEIEERQLQLIVTTERLQSLQKEKEVFHERELELLMTIQILKQEVDELTRYKSQQEASTATTANHGNGDETNTTESKALVSHDGDAANRHHANVVPQDLPKESTDHHATAASAATTIATTTTPFACNDYEKGARARATTAATADEIDGCFSSLEDDAPADETAMDDLRVKLQACTTKVSEQRSIITELRQRIYVHEVQNVSLVKQVHDLQGKLETTNLQLVILQQEDSKRRRQEEQVQQEPPEQRPKDEQDERDDDNDDDENKEDRSDHEDKVNSSKAEECLEKEEDEERHDNDHKGNEDGRKEKSDDEVPSSKLIVRRPSRRERQHQRQHPAGSSSSVISTTTATSTGTASSSSSSSFTLKLAHLIGDISKRLESIENDRLLSERSFADEIKRKEDEIDEIRHRMERDSKRMETLLRISQDSEEIELYIPSPASSVAPISLPSTPLRHSSVIAPEAPYVDDGPSDESSDRSTNEDDNHSLGSLGVLFDDMDVQKNKIENNNKTIYKGNEPKSNNKNNNNNNNDKAKSSSSSKPKSAGDRVPDETHSSTCCCEAFSVVSA